MNRLALILVCLPLLAPAETVNVRLAWPATGETNRVMVNGVQRGLAWTNATVPVLPHEMVIVSVFPLSGREPRLTGRFSIEPVPRWGHPQFRDGTNWVTIPLVAGQRVEATNNMQLFRSVMTRNREPVRWYRNWRGTNEVWGARYL